MPTFLAHRTKIVSFVVNFRFGMPRRGRRDKKKKYKHLLIYRTYHRILWEKLF